MVVKKLGFHAQAQPLRQPVHVGMKNWWGDALDYFICDTFLRDLVYLLWAGRNGVPDEASKAVHYQEAAVWRTDRIVAHAYEFLENLVYGCGDLHRVINRYSIEGFAWDLPVSQIRCGLKIMAI